jgi:hypothetical protein
LIETGERAHAAIALMALDATVELVRGQEVHQLSEHDPSGMHGPILSSEGWKNHGQTGRASRNQKRSPCNVTFALSSTCI